MLFLKPASEILLHFTLNQMHSIEQVRMTQPLCKKKKKKRKEKHTQVRFSCPLKIKPGQMIKKGKNSVQYFLTKWWNTEFQVNAILCVCILQWALAKMMPWFLKVWVLLLEIQASRLVTFIPIKVCPHSLSSSQLFVQSFYFTRSSIPNSSVAGRHARYFSQSSLL